MKYAHRPQWLIKQIFINSLILVFPPHNIKIMVHPRCLYRQCFVVVSILGIFTLFFWMCSSQLKQYIEIFCDKMIWVFFGKIKAILGDYIVFLTWFVGSVAMVSRFADIYPMKPDVCPFSNRQNFNWQQVNSYYRKLGRPRCLHSFFLEDLFSLGKLEKWLCVEASLRSSYFPAKERSGAQGRAFFMGIGYKFESLPWSFTRS